MMGSEEKGIDVATLKPEHQIAVEVLTGICNCMEQNAYPVVRDVQGAYLNIEIMGDDMRSTYGRLGASLDALQLLSNTIVARRTRGDVRVILDAGGYRERRIETLTERALEMAKAVKEHNQEAEMEPLPPTSDVSSTRYSWKTPIFAPLAKGKSLTAVSSSRHAKKRAKRLLL